MRYPLQQFTALMPQTEVEYRLDPGQQDHGISNDVMPGEPYVWPDVEVAEDPSRSEAVVVLISAPGAMGKSFAASNVAHRARSLYIDLAQLRVGTGSLMGELTKALGFEQIGPFVGELKSGQVSLVLDGMDEALLRAGRENYRAFLGDLWWLLSDAVASNAVVLLGRPDATDTTADELRRLGLPLSIMSIAPLSHNQAVVLLNETLDRRRVGKVPYEVHRRHPEPFAQLREAVFRNISQALSETPSQDYWTDNEGFLGYPPVVLALAERLAVDNPADALSEESGNSSRGRRGDLLRAIVEYILNREARKVGELVGDALGLAKDASERTVLYGADEQVARLLDFTGTVGISRHAPAVLDDADRSKYEESVEGFLIDHPFLRTDMFSNVVFSDYARAWAISSPTSELFAVNRAPFLGSLPKAGPFFAYFLHALSSREDIGQIPEDLVDDAVRSFRAGVERASVFYGHRDERAWLLLWDELHEAETSLGFEVTELSGVLTLGSPISRALITTEHAVILRGGEGGIDFGPSSSIIAGEVEIVGKSFTAFGREDTTAPEGGSNLENGQAPAFNMISAGLVKHDADLKVQAIPPTALLVYWPDHWHQWKEYYADVSLLGSPLQQGIAPQVIICLRRLLTSFRSSVRDEPSVSAEKMDQLLVGDNEVFQATHSALLELGVISREGQLYRLHLDELAQFKLAYNDLRGDDPLQSLKSLFIALVGLPVFDRFRVGKSDTAP